MTLAFALLAVLVFLEVLGRIVYPFSREALAARATRRDFRLRLSYLGVEGDAQTLLRELNLMEKRYLSLLGWLPAPNIRLSTIATNAQGFRDKVIEPRKPGEYRILVTGGSFAWGVGATSNAMTVTAQLERLLNRQEGKPRYLVMSGTYLGWSSRHEYVLVTEFFELFDPDLVISLTGYNDLVVVSRSVEVDALPEASLVSRAVTEYLRPVGTLKALRKVAGTLGIWRIVVLLREEFAARGTLPQQFYQYNPQDSARHVERIAQRYLSIADYLARKGRPYLIALEPEIYSSNKPLTLEEFDLKSRFLSIHRDILPTITRYRRELNSRLVDLAGERFRFLDLADVFDNEADPVFIDDNHVCDRGYVLVAEALNKSVAGL